MYQRMLLLAKDFFSVVPEHLRRDRIHERNSPARVYNVNALSDRTENQFVIVAVTRIVLNRVPPRRHLCAWHGSDRASGDTTEGRRTAGSVERAECPCYAGTVRAASAKIKTGLRRASKDASQL